MMNLLDLIRSSKKLLHKCLELYDSLENELLSDVLTNEDKNEILDNVSQSLTKLKISIKDAEDVRLKTKTIPECMGKNQNGGSKHIQISMVDVKYGAIVNNDIGDVAKKNSNGMTDIYKNGIDVIGPELSDGECSSIGDEEPLVLGVSMVLNEVTKIELNETDDLSDDDCSVKLIVDETVYDNNQSNKSQSTGGLSITDRISIKDCSVVLPISSIVTDIDNTVEENVNDTAKPAYVFSAGPDSKTMNIQNKTAIMMNECYVVLKDIALGDKKIIFDADRYSAIKRGTKTLRKNSKRTSKRSKKNNKGNGKKSIKDSPSKISKTLKCDSEDNNSQVSVRSVHLDITNTDMIDSPLSSAESESSTKVYKTKRRLVKKKTSRPSENLVQRRVTRSLMIPLSDSDTPQRTRKQSKKIDKISDEVVCLSSTSDEEPGALGSDMPQQVRNKGKEDVTVGRRGTKRKLDIDDDEGIDSANGIGTPKNIHKILKNGKLSEATKGVEIFEIERRKRTDEKQEMYNRSMNNNDAHKSENISSLVLEKDQYGESIVEVHHHIAEKLKGHQVDAVQFMYDCVIESILCLQRSQEKCDGEIPSSSAVGGCILAHCMGLGKSLSLIAFMHTMLTTPILNLYTCIIVCPVNTALNWKREWEMWMPSNRPVKIFEVSTSDNTKSNISVVQEWYKKGGILIIGYSMFRLLSSCDFRTIRSKVMREKMFEALIDPGADFIVCDEGHFLKNDKAAITKIVDRIKTNRRIILTGTPLQNRLLEYHTMVNFVKPNLIGTQKEFLNRFVNPINNGQHINSTAYDVQVMKKRSHILFKTLDGCVHRRDYGSLVKYLPPKYEYVIKIRMSDIQRELYTKYLSIIQQSRLSIFQDQTSLARIWTHPFMLYMHQEIEDKKAFFVESDEESFTNDNDKRRKKTTPSKKPLEENNVINLVSDESQNEDSLVKVKDEPTKMDVQALFSDSSVEEIVRNRGSRSRRSKGDNDDDINDDDDARGNFEIEGLKDTVSEKHWWSKIVKPHHEHQIDVSGKLTVLFQILRKAGEIGDKVIVFTQSLMVLDIIEKYLIELHTVHQDLRTEATNSEFFSATGYNTWEKGLDYDRMDGSTHVVVGEDIQARFSTDSRLRLFLVSTRAGGMGVNLVAANRVVIFDVSWNPSDDIQALFRSYRFGQEKPVYVYRLVSQGTMEERMYERQVTKLSLSLRVVDEQLVSRYFTEEDLKTLYKFEPDIYDPQKELVVSVVPRDRFLAELITEFPECIFGYHEHDSLLENKKEEEEELTDAELREAWKEFEEDKLNDPRQVSVHVQENVDSNKLVESQVRKMTQQYPQYAALYAQNYVNLQRYALNQRPDLENNSVQLNARMQAIFITSLQKHISASPAVATPKFDGTRDHLL